MTQNFAYEYCKNNINLETTPKYVRLQMRDFLDICDGKSEKYMLNSKKIAQMEWLLKALKMPKGLKAGQSLFECTANYQWLFYTAVLGVVFRDNPEQRRYEIGVLEICRKNFKTYTIAIIFIILLFLEPKYSKFFSVAPDGALSREIKNAIEETLKSSPKAYMLGGKPRFKILRDIIKMAGKDSTFQPLAYSTSRMDGKMPKAWIADEVGALKENYPISAMLKGQTGVPNKLGFIISTKYNTIDNPFEDEVEYSKRVLNGLEKDEHRFSLLFEPDTAEGWESNDLILKQANPVSLEIPEIWEDLVKQRNLAIAIPNQREEFLTKNCNIIFQGGGIEAYVDVQKVRECKVENINWNGRTVYVGVDLSETDDNTAVSFVSVDDEENILIDSYAFIPKDKVHEKTVCEKINYNEFCRQGKVFPCGTSIIDYAYVEDFVLKIQERFGVCVQAIGYDRWNARRSAQTFEQAGFKVVEVPQTSRVLHPAIKFLKEKILQGSAKYTKNPLLEINFQNVRCLYDTNRNLYIAKKKSRGKIDMVASLVTAVYIAQEDCFFKPKMWAGTLKCF